MTDKIKQDYVEHMNSIKPDSRFLASLQETLEQEQKNLRERKRIRLIRTVCAAAACLALGIGIFAAVSISRNTPEIIGGPQDSSASGDMINHGAAANSSVIDTVPVKNISWIPDDLRELPLTKALALRLENSLEELSVSGENRFVDADTVSGQELSGIIEKLNAAESAAASPEGEVKYYMAVFEDMTAAKFSIAENGVISISGSEENFL